MEPLPPVLPPGCRLQGRRTLHLDLDRILAHLGVEERVKSDVRYEAVPGWDDPFPHIYGPLNLDAVTATLSLERGLDGRYAFAG